MTTATPQLSKNPLADQIRSVHRGISKEASRLSSQGKHITFVMCTQGVPTDANGRTGPDVLQEFERELLTLSKLPVKIVLRLCTDDTKVMDIYNAFDSKFDFCDVLDDYWGEVSFVCFVCVSGRNVYFTHSSYLELPVVLLCRVWKCICIILGWRTVLAYID